MTKLTTEVDKSTVAAGGSSVRAAVTLQPGMQETPVTRQISLCLDTSGSMSGAKIEQLREGVRWVFGYLEDDDHISIVSFSEDVEVVLPATRWGDITLDEAEAAVDDLEPGGGTDVLAGLEAAADTVADLPTGEDVGRRILLLSDGRDETMRTEFASFARRVRREDAITIPAAGIGEFYDEGTIRAVGSASDGEWVHLSAADDIENFFGRKVETLNTVVAPSPHLQFDLAEGATMDEVYLRRPQVRDASYERVGDTVRVFLPDLVEFETQEVVCTIDTPRCTAGTPFTLADVTLNTSEESVGTAIEVTCAGDVSAQETRIDDESVTVKHVETMVRKAASEGDVERAETIVEQATDDPDAVASEETVVQDEPVTSEETVIAGDTAAEEDESVTDHETVVGGGGDAGEDGVTDQETVIAGADDPAESVTDLRTVIGEDDLAELETVIDDETVADLDTVVESADEADLAAQYETTKIEDEDHR
jgi:Ca-activated chloride channel family protein